MKKIVAWIVGVIAFIGIAWKVTAAIFMKNQAVAVGIIGGADGPTSIFLLNSLQDNVMTGILFVIGVIFIGIGIYLKFQGKK